MIMTTSKSTSTTTTTMTLRSQSRRKMIIIMSLSLISLMICLMLTSSSSLFGAGNYNSVSAFQTIQQHQHQRSSSSWESWSSPSSTTLSSTTTTTTRRRSQLSSLSSDNRLLHEKEEVEGKEKEEEGNNISRRNIFVNTAKSLLASLTIPALTMTIKPNPVNALLLQFPIDDIKTQPLKNKYHFIRAGTSELELNNILSTNPLFLTNRDNALSSNGYNELTKSLDILKDETELQPTVCFHSLAANGMDTGDYIARELKLGRDRLLPEFTYLDRRGIGLWDSSSIQDVESAIWAMDYIEAGVEGFNGRPPPNTDGTPNDTLHDQFTRLRQFISLQETRTAGDIILVIFPDGTGPALLECMIAGIPFEDCHIMEYVPGEIRLDRSVDSITKLYNARKNDKEYYTNYLQTINDGKIKLQNLRNTKSSSFSVSYKDSILNSEEEESNKEFYNKQKEILDENLQIEKERQQNLQEKIRIQKQETKEKKELKEKQLLAVKEMKDEKKNKLIKEKQILFEQRKADRNQKIASTTHSSSFASAVGSTSSSMSPAVIASGVFSAVAITAATAAMGGTGNDNNNDNDNYNVSTSSSSAVDASSAAVSAAATTTKKKNDNDDDSTAAAEAAAAVVEIVSNTDTMEKEKEDEDAKVTKVTDDDDDVSSSVSSSSSSSSVVEGELEKLAAAEIKLKDALKEVAENNKKKQQKQNTMRRPPPPTTTTKTTSSSSLYNGTPLPPPPVVTITKTTSATSAATDNDEDDNDNNDEGDGSSSSSSSSSNDEGDWLRVLSEIRDDKYNENDNDNDNINDNDEQQQQQQYQRDYDYDEWDHDDDDDDKKSNKIIGAAVFDNE